jgi:hypothetical protein
VTGRWLVEESLRSCQQRGDELGTFEALGHLGGMALAEGNLELARARFDECLSHARALDARGMIIRPLQRLGVVAQAQGDLVTARSRFRDCLASARDVGQGEVILACLECLAGLATATGHATRAACLFGAAQALREVVHFQTGTWLGPNTSRDAEIDLARAELGERAFAAAWVAGQAMTLEQAVADALADDAGP